MTLSDLDYIRLVLTLPRHVIFDEVVGQGNDTATKFKTRLCPLLNDTVILRVAGVVVDPTDYTVDEETGLLTLTTAPTDGDQVDVDYSWSVFSDDQIDGLLDRYSNSVVAVLKDLITALLSNTDLFIKYTLGMESVDRSAALDALKAIKESVDGKSAAAAAQAVIWTQTEIDLYERDVRWEPFISSTPEG